MTEAEKILQLCGVLSFYADRLDLMRKSGGSAGRPAYGANYLSDRLEDDPYGEIRPWYKVIEPIYVELDGLMSCKADTSRKHRKATIRLRTHPAKMQLSRDTRSASWKGKPI